MRFIVLSDLHSGPSAVGGARRGDLAEFLLKRAVSRINRFLKPDLTVLLGDLLDDGTAPDARDRLERLKANAATLACPTLVLPGNHDGNADAFFRVFPPLPACVDIAGVRFLPFVDPEEPGWNARRDGEDLCRMHTARADGWRGPVVCLQHVPLFPPGASGCPFNYINAPEAIAAAESAGIDLVVSGHFHAGFDPLGQGLARYVGAPALCEFPFAFLQIDLADTGQLTTIRHALAVPPELDLFDCHVHSQFAYCSKDMNLVTAAKLAKDLGLGGTGFTEHTGQLYFDPDTFWSGRFLAQGLDGREGRIERAADFFAAVRAAGIAPECVGLEVDCDFRGQPVLTCEDRTRAGFLLGATHWLPCTMPGTTFDLAVASTQFLHLWKGLLAGGIDVLAHPFRHLHRRAIPPPADLSWRLVQLLRQAGAAAEINFHIQEPHPLLFQQCLEAGVRIALGSDSHELIDIGDLHPHLDLLYGLGVSYHDLPRVLWRPEHRRRRQGKEGA